MIWVIRTTPSDFGHRTEHTIPDLPSSWASHPPARSVQQGTHGSAPQPTLPASSTPGRRTSLRSIVATRSIMFRPRGFPPPRRFAPRQGGEHVAARCQQGFTARLLPSADGWNPSPKGHWCTMRTPWNLLSSAHRAGTSPVVLHRWAEIGSGVLPVYPKAPRRMLGHRQLPWHSRQPGRDLWDPAPGAKCGSGSLSRRAVSDQTAAIRPAPSGKHPRHGRPGDAPIPEDLHITDFATPESTARNVSSRHYRNKPELVGVQAHRG